MAKVHYDLKKQPLQERARFTVNSIKEAAAHILKKQGYSEFTTNKVAEKAGVSIGSLYQYFPSKESLIAEIKRDHFKDLRQLMKQAYDNNQDKSLNEIIRALIIASLDAHQLDPQLHKILSGEFSEFKIKEDNDSDESIRSMVIQLLESHKNQLRDDINIPLAAKLIYKMVESITHDAVINSPELLQEDHLIDEISNMVIAYLK